MNLQISRHSSRRHDSGGLWVRSIDLPARKAAGSSLLVMDEFRVGGNPFPPHPHAGFSAVTYVFEDSAGGLRSRDSLGNDVRVGPGGIVWTQAARGLIHHELPRDAGRELHGAQIFVNLSARSKFIEPDVLWLDGPDVPQWTHSKGDRVRVVVGSYRLVTSPLTPAEPFTLLDLDLRHAIELPIQKGQHATLYVTSGQARILAAGGSDGFDVAAGSAVTVVGTGAVQVESTAARALFLVGQELHDPVVTQGSFIMNSAAEIDAAMTRYANGQMGRLAALPTG